MHKRFPQWFTAVLTAMSLLLGLATAASADVVTAVSVGGTGNQTKVPGASGSAQFYLTATNGVPGTPDFDGCNATAAKPATITVTSSNQSVLAFGSSASSSATVIGCGDTNTTNIAFSVSPTAAPGTVVTLTAVASGGTSNSKYQSTTISVTITNPPDTAKPTVSAMASPAGTWVNTDPVTVTIHAVDDTVLKSVSYAIDGGPSSTTLVSGGVETADVPVLVNGNGGHTVTFSATDGANNVSAPGSITVQIDTLKPTLLGAVTTPVSGTDNLNQDWYNGQVTVAWTPADQTGLSGIDPATDPADTIVSTEGAGQTAGPATVKDNAGNTSAPASVTGINIDLTKPGITPETNGPAGNNDWYTGPVTVHYICTDALSKVKTCPSDDVISTEGINNSSTGTATDYAGNSDSASVTGIKIDATPPKSTADISCTDKNGFCRATATVTLSANDASGSGVAAIKVKVGNAGGFANYPTNGVIVPLNGNGTAEVTYYAIDNAGNAEAEKTASIKYDTIAPNVKVGHSPSANAAGWNKSAVDVTFTATDPVDGATSALGSGVETLTVDGAPVATNATVGDQTPLSYSWAVTVETPGDTKAASAEDFAGNVSDEASETVKLDKTAPKITGSRTPAANSNGWNNGPVTVDFTCEDRGSVQSGVADCIGDTILNASGANQSAPGTTSDKAGNTASATVDGINIDIDNPTLTNLTVTNGNQYLLGAVPTASCVAADDLSGPDGCVVTVAPSQGNTSTNGVGSFDYTATAKDKAGNTATESGKFTVVYRFDGFLQPINDTAHNVGQSISVFKAGSTVPAKFQLKRADGTVVQSASLPKWVTPAKGSAMSLSIDESLYGDVATTGATYRWDATSQQYIYNWGTPKNSAGYFWRIGLQLDDGQTYWVNVGLR